MMTAPPWLRAPKLAVTVMAIAALPAASVAATHPMRATSPQSLHASAVGTITTIAGGVGGPAKATATSLGYPCGIASSAGNLYVAQTTVVRRVAEATDELTSPVGVGIVGSSPNGTPASSAEIGRFPDEACGVAADAASDLALVTSATSEVRFVPSVSGNFYGQAMTAGDIYTVAGDGTAGFSGDGGPATSAELDRPTGVAFDSSGNLLVADWENDRIRVVAASTGIFYGQSMTAGDIYTIAGDGKRGFSGDGGPAVDAELALPQGIAVDSSGNVVIADTANDRIRVVAANTGTYYGQSMTAGDIYTIAGDGSSAAAGDGGPAVSAGLTAVGVAVDPAGNLVIADAFNNRIRLVAATSGTFYGQSMTAGDIYTIAGDGTAGFSGDGGTATLAELSDPQGVTVDSSGNVVVADSINSRVRLVAARTGTYYGRAMTAGDIYTIGGNGSLSYSGDGGPSTRAQLNLFESSAVRVDHSGNILIADTTNDRVRVAAQRSGRFYGRVMRAGHIYTVAGDGSEVLSGRLPNGVAATKTPVVQPSGVAVGADGSVLIAASFQGRVRVVAERTARLYGRRMKAGDIYTIAGDGSAGTKTGRDGDGGPAVKAELYAPTGVAVDHSGNVLIADSQDCRIRLVAERTARMYGQRMRAGDIYTIAGDGVCGYAGDGGRAVKAELYVPYQVAVDRAGDVLIADTFNNRIRVVAARTGLFYGQRMTAGHIYTIAGDGTEGYQGDGGPATEAEIDFPADVGVDASGNVVLAEQCQVRVVAARDGVFYGQHMTSGDIYTVAGSQVCGYAGDGGPARDAQLCGQVSSVAIAASGNLIIGDCIRIREVTG
jgi:trimeric autotransporter adhesin